jgi:hypothetical protein
LQRQQSPNDREAETGATGFGRVECPEELLRIDAAEANATVRDVDLTGLPVIDNGHVNWLARPGLAGIQQ